MVLSERAPVFLCTVVVSVDCLAILLKDIENIKSLGVLLGLQEGMLEAIKCYYNNERALINRHVINMWVLSCLQDPIQQLRDALYQLKAIKIAQTLVLLTSIGRFIHLHYHFSCILPIFCRPCCEGEKSYDVWTANCGRYKSVWSIEMKWHYMHMKFMYQPLLSLTLVHIHSEGYSTLCRVCPSVHLSVCLSVCLSIWLLLLNLRNSNSYGGISYM